MKRISTYAISLGLLAIFVLAYIFTFPQGWLVSDVYSYFNQGLAIAQGHQELFYLDPVSGVQISYSKTRYTLGNAFWIAMWVSIFGKNLAYIGSLIACAGGVYLMMLTLRRSNYFSLASALIFCYPAFLFFSHSMMSGVPSFFIVCLFLFLLFTLEENGKKWFVLSLIAAFSFWFREPNIVLLGGICLVYFFQEKKWFLYFAVGAIIGFLPRLASAYYYYDDPFYMVLAESFSFGNIWNNILVYFIFTMIFMPLGLVAIFLYKGRYRWPIVVSTVAFLILYLTYSFNATEYSGFAKGVILMGRFLLPVVPIYALAAGWYLNDRKIPKWIIYTGSLCIAGLLIAGQYIIYKEASIHKNISINLYEEYKDKCVLYDLSRLTNVVRYANPMHGEFAMQSDISKLQDIVYTKQYLNKCGTLYLITTENGANSAKTAKTSTIQTYIVEAREHFTIEPVERKKIKPGLYLTTYSLTK